MTVKYGVLEISPINENQAKVGKDFIQALPEYANIFSSVIEHTPVAGNEELPANTLRISLSGLTADLVALRNAIVTEATNRGLTVSLNKATDGLIVGIKNCVLTHGKSLAARPALKACMIDIFKENRTTAAADIAEFKALLKKHGFNRLSEFKAWLNETP